MKQIANAFLRLLKYPLLITSFALTLFVVIRLNARLEKNIMDSAFIFIPYALLFILFIINMFISRDSINKNIFFNITCNLVFITNIVVCLRAIFDKNMLFNGIQKMGVNFNYYNDYLSFNRTMLFGLCAASMIFLLVPNEKKEVIEEKSEKKVTKAKKVKENS